MHLDSDYFVLFVIVSAFFLFGFTPDSFAANANLFVSAENSQFDNYMSGPQVIEVVVIESSINDTDIAKGEPEVTVNGKILRMTQAVDGNWYGYFADRNMALLADSTSQEPGVGLDFGYFCSSDVTITHTGSPLSPVDFSDTVGVAFDESLAADSNGGEADAPIGGPITADCGVVVDGSDADDLNVVREEKQNNENTPADGQIGVPSNLWPFIQLYTLNPTGNVVIQYNKGGGAQTTTLTFDSVGKFAGAQLDKASYGQGDVVLATITDLWLNIDPTDEDSWTFGTTGIGNDNGVASTNYQVFNENGHTVGVFDTNAGVNNLLTDKLKALMCEDNCVLLTTADVQGVTPVITLDDNKDSVLTNDDGNPDPLDLDSFIGDGDIDPNNPFDWQVSDMEDASGDNFMLGNVPITITEQGPHSGVFGTYDESYSSSIRITNDVQIGTSALIDYNQDPQLIIISNDAKGGDNQWDTRPTFGISHETRGGILVENGFSFNGDYFTVTDNHHTDFEQQSVEIGTTNSFSATVFADKKLKVQEFLFGIPNVGESHLAELGVEVWYDTDGNIEDIVVVQQSDVIDGDTVNVTHKKTKCLSTDSEPLCDTTTVSMTFLEPLADKVMAIKAIDFKLRDQRTYLNDGFDISGESLNPMKTKMIPSHLKNQGLIKVTQLAKYSPYWQSENGRLFEMNDFGSFKEINQSFERFQDIGDARTRMHSDFGGLITQEKNRAIEIFDSSELISKIPDSFSYSFEIQERINNELQEEMKFQEIIAMKILENMDNQDRNY